MWYSTLISCVILQAAANTLGDVTEPRSENCTDPNAEWRMDNENCTGTCMTKFISPNNPGNCIQPTVLKADCYCKQGFVLDTATNSCLSPEKCPCDSAANLRSRYSNKCANTCATFHTLTNCPGELTQNCWCSSTYCQNDAGICIEKE